MRNSGRSPIALGVVAAAVLLLAVIAAPRIPLELTPAPSMPELTISLRVPFEGAGDPVETVRRWVVPVEAAVRSLGDVAGSRGEVRPDAATIMVRFTAGTDAELKAARLGAELAPLRARLPRDASITVWPSSQNGARPAAIIALTHRGASDAATRVAEELRSASGVRDVQLYGATSSEAAVDLAPFAGTTAADAGAAAVTAMSRRQIGVAGTRAVLSERAATSLQGVLIHTEGGALLPLRTFADIRDRTAAAETLGRLNGRPAVAVAITRDSDVPLFAFDAAVRDRLRGRRVEWVWDEAAELRALLLRSALAFAVAALLLGAAGFWLAGTRGLLLGLYVPLALALAINLCRLTSFHVDAETIAVALIVICGVTPFAVLRLTATRSDPWPFLADATVLLMLPVAITLVPGPLATVLARPARAFAICAGAALVAAAMLPLLGRHRRRSPFLRRGLRASASVVLAGATITCALLSYFGSRLDPRTAEETERGRMYVRVTLPAGTTLAQTVAGVERIEKSVRGLRGVQRCWAFVSPGSALVTLDLTRTAQRIDRFRLLQIELRNRLPLPPGVATIDDRFDRAATSRFAYDSEDKPAADEYGSTYRVLIKGTDAAALQRVAGQIETRLGRLGQRLNTITREWPGATSVVELVPRRDTTPAMAVMAATTIATRTLPPRARTLPDGRPLTVRDAAAPRRDDDIPSRHELFGWMFGAHESRSTIDRAFDARTAMLSGSVTRELGRYVLPVTVRVNGHGEEKLKNRTELDRAVSLIALPAGTIIERPALETWIVSKEELRLFALSAFLPSLLLMAATVILSSWRQALIALAPSFVGVACTAPALLVASARVDELTLAAMACAVCCAVAASVSLLLRFRGNSVPALYRATRTHAAPLLAAAIVAVVTPMTAASALTSLGDSWSSPLLASATVLGAALAATLLLPAAITLLSLDVARRRDPAARASRQPAAWLDPAAPATLTVRNVSKRYATGFRALTRVSFDLEPGIIGLLGPNGAGKTTLLRILTGLLLPTRGQVLYRGVPMTRENLSAYRARIGFLPQEFNAYAGLTAAQFLDYWAVERGIDDARARRAEVERLLVLAHLEEHANRRVREFSGGMRQRIGIVRALLGDPKLLVIDEPTTGLDIEARSRFRELITALARDRIIILSTHIASDVEQTASRILLLSRGALRWDGTPDALIAAARGRVFETVVDDADARLLKRRCRITTRVRIAHGIRLRGVVSGNDRLPGPAVEPSLEEAYLAMIGADTPMRSSSFSFLFEQRPG